MTNGRNNQREYYRISYRAPDQPIFECTQGRFALVDLSEGGFRFAVKKGLFNEKDYVEGIIAFPKKRGSVAIKGRVLRVFDQEVAVQLNPDSYIPLAKIMEEQRILIQKGKL